MTSTNKHKRLSNVGSVSIQQVIVVNSIVGSGTGDDPVRRLIEYFSMSGELLARNDTIDDLVAHQQETPTP